MEKYDSYQDTLDHVHKVQKCLNLFAECLKQRARVHDQSKFEEPEKSKFDEVTPKLKNLTYGSQEYKESLEELKEALQHHYENNSHHPEYYENGVYGMDLLDLVEMFWDWYAASTRHNDGDIYKSIEINEERFEITDQLKQILFNTAKNFNL